MNKETETITRIILAADNVIDNAFQNTETLTGNSKPISEGAVCMFSYPKTAFWLDCICKTFISFS